MLNYPWMPRINHTRYGVVLLFFVLVLAIPAVILLDWFINSFFEFFSSIFTSEIDL